MCVYIYIYIYVSVCVVRVCICTCVCVSGFLPKVCFAYFKENTGIHTIITYERASNQVASSMPLLHQKGKKKGRSMLSPFPTVLV